MHPFDPSVRDRSILAGVWLGVHSVELFILEGAMLELALGRWAVQQLEASRIGANLKRDRRSNVQINFPFKAQWTATTVAAQRMATPMLPPE